MNKLTIIIKILFFITLTSCFEKETELYQKIAEVDTLIRQNHRDSAKVIFGSLDITNAKRKDMAYYNILAVRLKKIDSNLINSLLTISENHYITTNEKNKLAEIYLWKSTYYFKDKDMYDSALYFFDKSELLALETKDYYLSSQIYYLKSIFHYYERNMTNVKAARELQMLYAEKSKNKRLIAYATLDKAIVYKDLNETDSAQTWLHLALLTASDIEPYDKAFIYNALGELSDDKDSEIAKVNFQKALDIYPIIPAQINLAKAYLNENKIDQVEKMCEEGLKYEWPETKIEFLKLLCQCKKNRNDNAAALKIQDMIISAKDSIIEILNAENKQIALTQHTNYPKTRTGNGTNFVKIIIIAVLLVGVSLFGVLYFHNLVNEIACRDKEILSLKQSLANEQARTSPFVTTGEKLYIQIVGNKPVATWTPTDMINFIEYYRTLNPEFINVLETEYKKLSPRNKITLILEHMGKKLSEILTIMSFEESSYRSAKSRINSQKIKQ